MIQQIIEKLIKFIKILFQMNLVTAKPQAQLHHRSSNLKNIPQIDIHIPVSQESTNTMDRNRQEVAVLLVKIKWRSTKVNKQISIWFVIN